MRRFTKGSGGLETACYATRYTHDCEYSHGRGCIFLGQYKKYDLYACVLGRVIDTVVARWSSDGLDYSSGLYCYTLPPLRKALRRAEYLGYRSRYDLST